MFHVKHFCKGNCVNGGGGVFLLFFITCLVFVVNVPRETFALYILLITPNKLLSLYLAIL